MAAASFEFDNAPTRPKGDPMKFARVVIAALLFGLSGFCSTANATAYSTDQSDLWWNPAESGWGIQLTQRGSVIYATMFVYNRTGMPTWYVATLQPEATPLTLIWSGSLYAATGPWFATAPFDPTQVQPSVVGGMTWTPQTVADGQLSYTINGVAVTKNVTRETIAGDDFSGNYTGGLHYVTTDCADSSLNGPFTQPSAVGITQSGTAISVVVSPLAAGASCTYAGTAQQFGQMGELDGTFTCTNGINGTFSLVEMQVNPSGITGRLQFNYASPQGCQASGAFGGVRTPTTFF
jgi:hypothetical protein